MTARSVLSAGVILLLAACTGTSSTPAQPETAETPSRAAAPTAAAQTADADGAETSATSTLGAPGCRPPSPIGDFGGLGPEVSGTATEGELWGLLFAEPPYRVGDEVKIAWRMTGTGDLQLTAIAPDGTRTPLTWGPQLHAGSSYDRPGDEWGAGYRFTQAGCWNLHAARDDTEADVWLMVS